MKIKLTRTLLAAATLLAVGCEQAVSQNPSPSSSSSSAAAAPVPETAVASPVTPQEALRQTLVTVNGQPITGQMFGIYLTERLQKMPGVKPSPQIQNQLINELINIMLLAQVARNDHLDSRPDVAVALELQHTEFLSRLALQEQAGKVTLSEDDLKKAYDTKYGAPTEEYKAAHILVKSEEEAKSILAELDQGGDFALLAKEHSIDSSAKKGGDLGWFRASQMVKPFSAAVAALEIGTMTQAPVKTQFGWHLIKLEDKRTTPPPAFASVRQNLLMGAQRKALSEYVAQLRTQAKIEINEALTKNVKAGWTN